MPDFFPIAFKLWDGNPTSNIEGIRLSNARASTLALKSDTGGFFSDDFDDNIIDPKLAINFWREDNQSLTYTSDFLNLAEVNQNIEVTGIGVGNPGVWAGKALKYIDSTFNLAKDFSFRISINNKSLATVFSADGLIVFKDAFNWLHGSLVWGGSGNVQLRSKSSNVITNSAEVFAWVRNQTYILELRWDSKASTMTIYVDGVARGSRLWDVSGEVTLAFGTALRFADEEADSYWDDLEIDAISPSGSFSPVSEWMSFPVGSVVSWATLLVSINSVFGDNGNVKFKIASNGGGDGTSLSVSEILLLPDLTITDSNESVKVTTVLISDGSEFPTVNIDFVAEVSLVLEPLPPEPVISGYIMPMIAELVRDQLGLIMSLEFQAQKDIAEQLIIDAAASPEGIQAQRDIDDKIFDIIDNMFIEKGTDFTEAQLPGMNIYFGRSDYPSSEGTIANKQLSESVYNIQVHINKAHDKKGLVIVKGDEKSARIAARILGIARAILMSGQYIRLGDTFDEIVWRRWVNSVDVFQPDFQENDGKHGIVGLLPISVKFNELGPEISGEVITATLTNINVKLRTDDEGKIIQIET